MNIAELRKKTKKELLAELKKQREVYSNLAQDVIKAKEKNTRKLRVARHDIARILTVLKEQELSELDLLVANAGDSK